MRLFGRRSKVKAVQVVFRDLARHDEGLPTGNAYTYAWRLKTEPHVGQWVWVQGSDRVSTACIAALGAGESSHGLAHVPVISVLSPDELAQFSVERENRRARKIHDRLVWLDMARSKAGLPVERELPKKTPGDLPAIPPVKGRVIGAAARERGWVWWRIYH